MTFRIDNLLKDRMAFCFSTRGKRKALVFSPEHVQMLYCFGIRLYIVLKLILVLNQTCFVGLFPETDGQSPWVCWLVFWLFTGGVVEEENMGPPIGSYHCITIPKVVHKGQDQTDQS